MGVTDVSMGQKRVVCGYGDVGNVCAFALVRHYQ